MLKLILRSFSNFNFPSVTPMDILRQTFLTTTCFRIMKFRVHLQVGKAYCVNKNLILSSFFKFALCSFCHT